MNWLWISGWAVPPAWLAAQARSVWPNHDHRAVSPSEAEMSFGKNSFEILGGYSLGALWLLRNFQKIPASRPVVLLAPIFAFPAEAGLGGRVALAQLKLQRRRLRASAPAAIADFLRRAELQDVPMETETETLNIPALDQELAWLETWTATAPPPENWQGFAGADDPLLDAARLREIWPKLHVIPDACHSPLPLMNAAAKIFPPR